MMPIGYVNQYRPDIIADLIAFITSEAFQPIHRDEQRSK